MNKIGQTPKFSESLLSEIRGLTSTKRMEQKLDKTDTQPKSTSFTDYLTAQVKEVNNSQKAADKAVTDLASGKSENIHETMLQIQKADLSLKTMMQVRNKILEAYKEIMRMQV